MDSPEGHGTPSAWSRIRTAVTAALSAVVRDRKPSRRSTYLIRGSGEGKSKVVGGGHSGGGM